MSTANITRMIIATLMVFLLTAAGALWADAESEQTTSAPAPGQVDSIKDSVFSDINAEYLTIKPIFEKSCFDCHSQNTEYPWYHSLPLIGGMMDDHIKEGREHLDLSNDFPFTGKESLPELLDDIKKEIAEEKMPLWSYRLMHWGTLIEGAQQDSVFSWIERAKAAISPFFGDEKAAETSESKQEH
ncbi:MAG: heme-binding domain-containing protein [Candidatus Zixiibacteriota bacterium]